MKRRSLSDFAELQALLARQKQQAEQAQRQARQDEVRRRAAEAARQHDANLFARSVGPVTPLRAGARAELNRVKPEPLPLQRERDEREVLREAMSDGVDAESLMETDDSLSYRRSWVGPDVVRKLRRGVWVVQGQIDLHGLRRDEAREALGGFVAQAVRSGWRCVRVVHGKGHGSPGRQPVLKSKVRHWLSQQLAVMAFTQARAPDGGAGALIVLLDAPAGHPPG